MGRSVLWGSVAMAMSMKRVVKCSEIGLMILVLLGLRRSKRTCFEMGSRMLISTSLVEAERSCCPRMTEKSK